MWVASYYRVIGREAYEERLAKAERMRRRSLIQGALRRWAAGELSRKRKRERDDGTEAGGEEDEGGAASRGRRDTKRPKSYKETRAYDKRPDEERERDLLTRKRRRVQVVVGTESGRRLYELMTGAAAAGGLMDRRGDG